MKKTISLVLFISITIITLTSCNFNNEKFVKMTEGCLELFINQDITNLKKFMGEENANKSLSNVILSEKQEASILIQSLDVKETTSNTDAMQKVIRKIYSKTKYEIGEVTKENKTILVNVNIYGIDFEKIIDETMGELEEKLDKMNNIQDFFNEFINIINQKIDSIKNLETPIQIQAKYNFDKGNYQLDESQEYNFLDKLALAALGYTE